MSDKPSKQGFKYQFFERQYPTWLYSVVMVLFAAGIFIWIKFFLVVR